MNSEMEGEEEEEEEKKEGSSQVHYLWKWV